MVLVASQGRIQQCAYFVGVDVIACIWPASLSRFIAQEEADENKSDYWQKPYQGDLPEDLPTFE
jgi:hypothetical protein